MKQKPATLAEIYAERAVPSNIEEIADLLSASINARVAS